MLSIRDYINNTLLSEADDDRVFLEPPGSLFLHNTTFLTEASINQTLLYGPLSSTPLEVEQSKAFFALLLSLYY